MKKKKKKTNGSLTTTANWQKSHTWDAARPRAVCRLEAIQAARLHTLSSQQQTITNTAPQLQSFNGQVHYTYACTHTHTTQERAHDGGCHARLAEAGQDQGKRVRGPCSRELATSAKG